MSEIRVPEGMLKASLSSGVFEGTDDAQKALEAALRWLSENPIVPDAKQVGEMVISAPYSNTRQAYTSTIFCITEWQKRMFLALEPKSETSFEERMNELTVEVNRLGMSAAIEILRRTR
jgi:hypothetical protein